MEQVFKIAAGVILGLVGFVVLAGVVYLGYAQLEEGERINDSVTRCVTTHFIENDIDIGDISASLDREVSDDHYVIGISSSLGEFMCDVEWRDGEIYDVSIFRVPQPTPTP